MIQIIFACIKCGKIYGEPKSMICRCGGELRGSGFPGIVNTRDSFGVGREFYDPKTGKYIDNFKSWEKAGFRNPGDTGAKNAGIIKEKVRDMKKHKSYQKKSKAIELAERI